jgi:ubiquinone/menaquinone biosynthesis C-methylase UbiE
MAARMTDDSARRANAPDARAYWNSIYTRTVQNENSWYQLEPTRSLELLADLGIGPDSAIIDVGGGDSTLVDALVGRYMARVTVLDISGVALERAQRRLGAHANNVEWIESDVRTATLQARAYDVWHDRAVFHFLTEREDRQRYIETATRSIAPGGAMVLATFGSDGPRSCSGLPVVRFGADTLASEVGNEFELVRALTEDHRTPRGDAQHFLYAVFRRAETRDT